MRLKAAQCLGLSSLFLLENYMDFLGGGGAGRMHLPFPVRSLVLANAADILLLALFFFAVAFPISKTKFSPLFNVLLLILVPLFFLSRCHVLLPAYLPATLALVLALLWPIVVLATWRALPRLFITALKISGQAVAVFAFFAVASLLQLCALAAWRPAPHEHAAPWQKVSEPPRDHARLVWIVFDELSYDQLFEDRDPSLQLASFDALRAISTTYTNVQPIGNHTVTILPSLLSGEVVDDYRYHWDNSLDLHFADRRGWHPANGHDSLFGQAQQAGWRTAAAAWYNPYCSVYAGAIDDCYWMNLDMAENRMAQDKSLVDNTLAPLGALVNQAILPSRANHDLCTYEVRQRLGTYLDLERHSLALLEKDQSDFVFLHLPVPHPPSIWNRATHQFRTACGGSYLDTLALTDIELGKILTTLKQSPRWPQTSLIVQGDHAWRTPLWRSLPAWSAEDAHAARDVFDRRPALIVHQGGESAPLTEDQPRSLLEVHTLIQQMLEPHPAAPTP